MKICPLCEIVHTIDDANLRLKIKTRIKELEEKLRKIKRYDMRPDDPDEIILEELRKLLQDKT